MVGFGAHTDWNDFLRRLQAQRDRDAMLEMERQSNIVALIRKQRDLLLGDFLLPRPDADSTVVPTPTPTGGVMADLSPMLVLSSKRDGGTQDTNGFFAPSEVEDCFVAAMNQIIMASHTARAIVRVELYNPQKAVGLFGIQPRAFVPRLIEHADGLFAIREERDRQLRKGYDANNDDVYSGNELAASAAWLLSHYAGGTSHVPGGINAGLLECARHAHDKHRNSSIRRLAIAGALIAAEIDRLERILARKGRG